MRWLRELLGREPAAMELDANLRKRIRLSFDEAASDEENFPSDIDPRILHVRLVLEQVAAANPRRVLDAGCGKGRFARVVKDRFPAAQVWGLDVSQRMLHCAREGVIRCAGSLTELPFASGSFDAAYATESIEHAVDIPAAVAELCRVVREGGRVVIIDKNAAQWGRLETPEWERWFGRKEMERLLNRHCREVRSQPISYWEDVEPDGLFLAWVAVR